MKKVMTTIVIIITVASFLSGADKKDTVTSNTTKPNTTLAQQNSNNKGLAKQNKVTPRKQSNWARIKDLFM